MLMPVRNDGLAQHQETGLNDLKTLCGNEEGSQDKIYVLRNGLGRCFVCQVDFTSDPNARQHLAGKKHMKNVANCQLTDFSQRGAAAAFPGVNQPIHTGFVSPGSQRAQGNMVQPQTTYQGAAQNPVLQTAVADRGPNGEDYRMDGSRGYCFVCKVDLTSIQHKDSHVRGQKHKKKCVLTGSSVAENRDIPVPQLPDNMSSKDGVLMCSLCNVPFSCVNNAREHFASDKHKKKVAAQRSMSSGSPETTLKEVMASNNNNHNNPEIGRGNDSPFVPLRSNRADELALTSGFTRPDPSKTAPPPVLDGINRCRLVHPVPQRAIPELQNDIDMTLPGATNIKEINTSKVESIIGGNLTSNVAEIAKFKNKEVLGASGPTCSSISSETSSDTNNDRYPQSLQRIVRYPNDSEPVQPPQAQVKPPLLAYTLNSISGQGFCNVCSVLLTSRKLADQHLNGQNHKKKEQHWTWAQQNQTFLNPVATSTPVIRSAPSDTAAGAWVSPSPVSGEEARDVTPAGQNQPDETCFFNQSSSRGFCMACDIQISSVQHFDQHRLGKPHYRKRQRYLLSQQGIVYPLECEVCKKAFTGQESAQQHFTSARHKSKMEIMGEGGREVERLEEGRVIMRDSQKWYVCDVCDCLLNTREQFEIHKASPRHKKKSMETVMAKVELEVPSATDGRLKRDESAGSTLPTVEKNQGENVLESNLQHLVFKPHSATNTELMQGENLWDFAQPPIKPTGLMNSGQLSHSSAVKGVSSDVPTERYGPDMRTWLNAYAPKQEAQSPDHSTPQAAVGHIPLYHGITYCPRSSGRQGNQTISQTERSGPAGGDNSTDQREVPLGGMAYHPRLPVREGHHIAGQNESPQPIGGDNSNNQRAVDLPFSCGTNNSRGAREGTNTAGPNERVGLFGGDNSNNQMNFGNREDIRGSCSPPAMFSPGFDGIARRPVVKHGNSNKSQGLPFRDITTMEQRLDSDELWEDSVEAADLEVERASYNISGNEVSGLASDLQRLHISNPQQTEPVIVRSAKPGFKYYCTVCQVYMNTKQNVAAHEAGNSHKFKVSTIAAPQRQLPPIRRVLTERVASRAIGLTKDTPRPYQLELLEKAMARDTVIYLPTGTGKTLVAVLTIGLMLQENERRPVLFLVDKVLLVLQQEKYIRQQFQGKMFLRPDVNKKGVMVDRELLVMAICGRLFSNRGIPIYEHDVIVTTADFCMNMLDKGWIRWDDFSLVVLDEVHHCFKNHPYLRLFDKHHQPSQQHQPSARVEHQREHPKVLGLSASPASKDTPRQTHAKLKELLLNLGGAHIAMVEENVEDLDAYQSNAKVVPICVPLSDNEREFTLDLLQYALKCYRQLAHLCPKTLKDFKSEPYSYFEAVVCGSEEDIRSKAESLMVDNEPLMEITTCLFGLQRPTEMDEDRSSFFDHLRTHLNGLLLLTGDIGSNSDKVAALLLKDLEPSEKISLFEKHSLPCSDMYHKVKHFAKYGSQDKTTFKKLIATLDDQTFVNWETPNCKALVLVQKRQEAKQLAHSLRDAEFVKRHGLQVSHLVGHGKGAQEGGMDVKKQKKVLDNQDRFQLIVATSIMEEGIDFQTLQLVVCMNPPTTVRALVQIRGRARRKNSHFVILCKTDAEQQTLNNLLQQEKNMAEAARLCLMEDRGELPC